MRKYYYLCLLFSLSLYSNQQKKKKQKKETVSFKEEVDQRTISIPFDQTMLGQIASYPEVPDFEVKGYEQTKLITDLTQAQAKLDEISDDIQKYLPEMNNNLSSLLVKFRSLSKNLNYLSKVFSHIIPKNKWDKYELKKYNLLAQRHNKLLKTPDLIMDQMDEMIQDFNDISGGIIMEAQSHLNKENAKLKKKAGNKH
jgi:hypothetical protein